uniref:CDC48 N-terminal subdomain domain-containing protein n=1 Tax=Panagrolaimus sp. JU765 TaxID=591449 RepID=A0AC34Q246_9BILA
MACLQPQLDENDEQKQLYVENLERDDNSVISMSQAKMDELGISRGDTVTIKGKKRKETVCIVLPEENCTNDKILMNRAVRKNLCARIGDTVTVHSTPDIKYGKQVHVLPIDDTVEGFTGNIFEVFLKPYFENQYRPIHKGDTFCVTTAEQIMEFKVIDCSPSPICIVAPDTVIHCEGAPVKRADEDIFHFEPIRLSVEKWEYDDSFSVGMAKAKMNEIGIFRGHTVTVKSETETETVAILLPEENCTNDKILMNR